MRIVQLLPALNEGGVERGVVELNREFVARGLQSIVISAGGRLVPRLVMDGGRHLQLDIASKNPLTAPWRAWHLRRLLNRLEPSIIHARSRVPAWLAVWANRGPRRPFVTTVHGLNSVNPYSRVMTYGDRVICVSEVVAAYVQEHYRVPGEKIRVIQRGVDWRVFDPAKVDLEFIRQFRAQYKLEGRKVALSVGRITWLKDYESFMDAIGLGRKSHPELVGVIVGGIAPGKEHYGEELRQRAAARGLGEHIIFAGSQTRMPELYALADVVVNVSLKMGNVGRTVAEGLAMNTPVLATTEKGLNNLVRDGVNGFIIPTRDPVALAGRLEEALRLPRAQIRATVPDEFKLERMVESTIGVYRELSA